MRSDLLIREETKDCKRLSDALAIEELVARVLSPEVLDFSNGRWVVGGLWRRERSDGTCWRVVHLPSQVDRLRLDSSKSNDDGPRSLVGDEHLDAREAVSVGLGFVE